MTLEETIRTAVADAVREALEDIQRPDAWFTVANAAKHLACSTTTIRKWLKQGRLPHAKIDDVLRIRRSDLERLLEPTEELDDDEIIGMMCR